MTTIPDDVREAVADELRASYIGYVHNTWDDDWLADASDVFRAITNAGYRIVPSRYVTCIECEAHLPESRTVATPGGPVCRTCEAELRRKLRKVMRECI